MAKEMSQQDSLELKLNNSPGLTDVKWAWSLETRTRTWCDGLAGSLAQGPRETRKGRTRAGEPGNKSYFLEASKGP
jgi:hypothetical protein